MEKQRSGIANTVAAMALVALGTSSVPAQAAAKHVHGVASAHSFAGTVRCQIEDDGSQSQVELKTRVFLNKPLVGKAAGRPQGAGPTAGVQLEGLAGTLGGGRRSQLTLAVASGTSRRAVSFEVAASPASGTYQESGVWVLGVNGRGQPTLTGSSTAVIAPAGETARSATCTWDLQAAAPVVGPVPEELIDAWIPLADPSGSARTNRGRAGSADSALGQAAPTGTSPSCGAVFGTAANLAWTASSVITFVPLVGPIFGVAAVASGIAGSDAGSACMAGQLAEFNQQFSTQAAQIEQIENFLGLATNYFYIDWYKVQLKLQSIDFVNWEADITAVSPAPSTLTANDFGTFMQDVRLWDDWLNPIPGAPTDSVQLASSLTESDITNTLNPDIKAAAENPSFQTEVGGFSGSELINPDPSCSVDCSTSTDPNCTLDCPVSVVEDPNSHFVTLLQDTFASLQGEINTYDSPTQEYNQAGSNQNVVPLYDQYNNMLVYYYQRALLGLQQAFTMEWMVNQINYNRAVANPAATQLVSYGKAPGTLYKYRGLSAAVEAAAFHKNQRNLAKLYAARLNRLYLNVLNYVVSDKPVVPQAYPKTPFVLTLGSTQKKSPGTLQYDKQVGSALPDDTSASSTNPAAPDQGRTPLELVPPTAAGPWETSAVLYQFVGIHDVAACANSILAYNQQGGSATETLGDWLQIPGNCPSVFVLPDGSALNGGFYDGSTLALYTSFDPASKSVGNHLRKTGVMSNNLKFCDPSAPSLGWYAPSGAFVGNAAGLTANTAYLNCGNWYTPMKSTAPCGFPRAICPSTNTLNSNIYDFAPGGSCASNIYTSIANDGAGQGCTNNLSMNGNKYPWILTLTDQFPSNMKSCGSSTQPGVITSVANPSTNTRSPIYAETRSEAGSYLSGGSGCSIGFIGTGLNNHIPGSDCVDTASFGMRLANFTNSGGKGAGSGWVLPVGVLSYCTNKHPYTRMETWQTKLADEGYSCALTCSSCNTLRCTIVDGTQYEFSLYQQGSALGLGVSILQ